MKDQLAHLLGATVSFYSKQPTLNVGCFVETRQNALQEQCVKAVDNGNHRLLPISELNERFCKFYAVLKSGPVKLNKSSQAWGLTVFELNVQDLDESDPEYQLMMQPTIMYADK